MTPRHAEADERTTIKVTKSTNALVEDFRRKGETKNDAVRRAIDTARDHYENCAHVGAAEA